MWSPCFLISSAERDEYDHPALRPFATIARSYIAIENQKQNAGLLCGNWRTIEMIGFTVNDRELFFAQKLGTSPPLDVRSAPRHKQLLYRFSRGVMPGLGKLFGGKRSAGRNNLHKEVTHI
jgi:hypothetical protein